MDFLSGKKAITTGFAALLIAGLNFAGLISETSPLFVDDPLSMAMGGLSVIFVRLGISKAA